MRRSALVVAVALLIGGCLGHRSRAIPTVVAHPPNDAVVEPAQLASEMAHLCRSRGGDVGFDVRQGTAHLHSEVSCALARDDRSGLEQELVELAGRRNDANRRADLVNTLAVEVGVHPFSRADLIWQIGTGADLCTNIDDVSAHRTAIAQAMANPKSETPLYWTKVEAVRYAGTCRKQLGSFFDSVASAGQPTAASTVRNELEHLGIRS